VTLDTGMMEEQVAKQKTPAGKPIGMAQIADMYGVDKTTPSRWQYRSRLGRMNPPMPEPDGWLSATAPWWWDSTITAWGEASGRATMVEVDAALAAAGLPTDGEPEERKTRLAHYRRDAGQAVHAPTSDDAVIMAREEVTA
jgi:hypothetical protein